MKVVYNNLIPFKGFQAMNLFGILFARKEYNPISKITLNHEAIHTALMKELWYIPFYLIYFLEWVYRLVTVGFTKDAYRAISFEKEAYTNQRKTTYLRNRVRFAQWK